ncbi:mechanosensitive ion channel family protein [Algoriphagus namhaensis]|uniref:Mechanosensitive ion channel family protein n=1 Tax=Algoriphagus namhaensis TaxID=915353 RepID=A0ABV8AT65_9BACT
MEITPEMMDSFWAEAMALIWSVIPKLIYALLFYLIGKFIINKLVAGVKRILEKRENNPSLNEFLYTFAKALGTFVIVIGVATILGVPLSSFIAIFGAAGLAIGLALQGSLSNFAGGLLILAFKPFKVGDVIEAQGHLGTVEKIQVLYTRMHTFDKKEIVIPNGNLANSDVVNMSTQPVRRVDLSVGVAYGSDIQKVREVVLGIFAKDERVHKDPAPVMFLSNFGDSSLDLSIRVWTNAENLWPVFFDSMEKINIEFEKNNIEIPFPQRVVHKGA